MSMIAKIKDEVVLSNVIIANNFYTRVIGLMFKKKHPELDGLLITPCNSIHTFFMRYEIDVFFLDKSNRVVKIIRGIKPWRMTWFYIKANKVLETKAGIISQNIKLEDEFVFE